MPSDPSRFFKPLLPWVLAGLVLVSVLGVARRRQTPGPSFLIATDYGSINQAVRSLPPGGGEVYIPAGRYVLTETILLGDNVTLRGSGNGTVLVAGKGLDTYFQAQKCYRPDEPPKSILDTPEFRHGALIKNSSADGNSGISIFDLALEGNRDHVKYPTGILFGGVAGAVIRNVKVTDCGASGITLLNCRDARIEGCTLERNHNGICIRGRRRQTRNLLITGCIIRNNRWSGIFVFGQNHRLKNGPQNLTITDNFILDHTNDDGIKLFGARYVVASGNRIDRANQCGIESHSSRDCVFNGNVITRIDQAVASEGVGICYSRSRWGTDHTMKQKVGYTAMVGNVIGDCGHSGIWSEDPGGRGFTVLGNVSYGHAQFGMGAGCNADAAFVGNVCLDIGRYQARAPKGRDVSGMLWTAGAHRINILGNVIADERTGPTNLMRDGLTIRASVGVNATDNIVYGGTNLDLRTGGNRDPVMIRGNLLWRDPHATPRSTETPAGR